jgi:tripartite-type tricarboxylate transporter receptor subunit TctC
VGSISGTKAACDPIKDFKPISVIGLSPQVLVVNARIPVADVAGFIGYVKTQPQPLPDAGGGVRLRCAGSRAGE